MDIKKDIELKEEGEKAYSNVGSMAVYGSIEAPQNHELGPHVGDLQTSDWSSNRIQVDCDNFASASDACMKKRNLKKRRFCMPGKFGKMGNRAKLGPKLGGKLGGRLGGRLGCRLGGKLGAKLGGLRLMKKNIKVKRRPKLCTRDWKRVSVHPFINFMRVYRKKFARNTPAEEIARRGRCEWRKLSCKTKEKFYEQAQRARMRGYRK